MIIKTQMKYRKKNFEKHKYTITKGESTNIPVSLKAWLALTNIPEKSCKDIIALMEEEIQGGELTGFAPYMKENETYFDQRWLLMIGIKQNTI